MPHSDAANRIYTPSEWAGLSDEEKKLASGGAFGRLFRDMAATRVTWIFWTRDTDEPTDVLGHGSAFILDRGEGPMMVTAAHVYRQYLADRRAYGPLYCQVANTRVRHLSGLLISCGNLHVPLGERAPEPDIATFRSNSGAVARVGKRPVLALGDWPPPPALRQQVMFGGYPGAERIFVGASEMDFGFYSGMTGASSITEHQIKVVIEREFLVDNTGHGLPPAGYGLGGVSGGPLLVPEYGKAGWFFRLGGVVSEAPGPRPADEVLIEMVVAERAEFIQPDGKVAKIL